MNLKSYVNPEYKFATGGLIKLTDADGVELADLDLDVWITVSSINPPSGRRLFNDEDRKFVQKLTKAINDKLNQ